MSIRSVERLTGIHRDTIMRPGARIGRGCTWLHDKTMMNLSVTMIELDELWSYVGKKRRQVRPDDGPEFGDQYVFIALGSLNKAILAYRVGKRNRENTEQFVADLRSRVTGTPHMARSPASFAGSTTGRSSSRSMANHPRMPPGATALVG